MRDRWLGSGAGARAQMAREAVSGALRLAGSNTIGSELAPDLLAAYGKEAGDGAAHGSGTAFPGRRKNCEGFGFAANTPEVRDYAAAADFD